MKRIRRITLLPILLLMILINLHYASAAQVLFIGAANIDEKDRPIYVLGQNLTWSYQFPQLQTFENSKNIEITTTFHYLDDTRCNPWWLGKNTELYYLKDAALPSSSTFTLSYKNTNPQRLIDSKESFELPIPYNACPGSIYSKTIFSFGPTKIVDTQEIKLQFIIQAPST